jgi:hypothetical protein
MRKIMAIGMAAVMVLMGLIILTPSAAAEGKPVKFSRTYTLTNSYLYESCGITGCSLQYDGLGVQTIKLFYNKEGDLVKEITHLQTRIILTCTGTGNSMRYDADLIRIIDYEKGTITINGVPLRFTYPGEGIVVHGSGTVTMLMPGGDPALIIHEGGQHPFLHGEITDDSIYCQTIC